MVISLIKLTPPPCNGFGAPIFQTLGGGDKNGVGGKGLGTRLVCACVCYGDSRSTDGILAKLHASMYLKPHFL